MSLIAATVTARLLGPSGKGFYSTLTLLSVLLVQVFNLGLGEAAVVLVGRGRAKAQTASSVTTMALIPLSLVGAACFLALASGVLEATSSNERAAIFLGTLLVLFNIWATALIWFLVMRERIVLVAGLTALSATVSTAALWYLVARTGQGVAEAVAAAVLGCAVLLVPLIVSLRSAEVSLRPRWDRRYLGPAVRFGAAVQISNLLVQMTGRIDLVLVYRIASPDVAGTYSIALTVGALVGGVPIALAFSSFPRLARLEDAEANPFILQLFRTSAVAAIGSAVVLALVTPVSVPLVFGSQYTESIAPTLILVAGGVFWSAQWILTRAAAARGRPKALFSSFALSLLVMLALDFVLIGPLEGVGAAIASFAGSVVGFLVAAAFYRTWNWRDFVPRWGECVYVFSSGRDMLGNLVQRSRPRP